MVITGRQGFANVLTVLYDRPAYCYKVEPYCVALTVTNNYCNFLSLFVQQLVGGVLCWLLTTPIWLSKLTTAHQTHFEMSNTCKPNRLVCLSLRKMNQSYISCSLAWWWCHRSCGDVTLWGHLFPRWEESLSFIWTPRAPVDTQTPTVGQRDNSSNSTAAVPR